MSEDAVEILLVEDNPNDVELALHAFRKNGLANRIQVVRDGAEALDFSGRSLRPRSGIPQPDPAGPQAAARSMALRCCARSKPIQRMRRLPVVVLTSSCQDRDIEECYNLGVNSYMVKPIDFEKFIEVAGILGMYWLHVQPAARIKNPTSRYACG